MNDMNEISVTFPECARHPEYAVIVARWQGRWIFVRHRDRDTWECPGGHIEPGEAPEACARRELYEEAGVTACRLWEIGPYAVVRGGEASEGILYFALVTALEDLPPFEIGARRLVDFLPDSLSIPLTYPAIQPFLYARAQSWLEQRATNVYMVRHARSDISVRDGRVRPLTEQGMKDAAALPAVFADIPLDAVYSSPYKRALDTVSPLAASKGLAVVALDGFHEQVTGGWKGDMELFIRNCWADFQYREEDGECLQEVQARNISALEEVLEAESGRTVAVGTHGTALCAMIHHYIPGFGVEDFFALRNVMPYVVRLEFLESEFLGMEELELPFS